MKDIIYKILKKTCICILWIASYLFGIIGYIGEGIETWCKIMIEEIKGTL